jgi:hypothetical protein
MFGWKRKEKDTAVAEKDIETGADDLKIKVKERKACQVILAVEVPAPQVKKVTEESFRRVQAKAKLPGFRPGKAPMDLIRKNFSAAAWEDAVDHLLRESVYAAAIKENIAAIATPSSITSIATATTAACVFVLRPGAISTITAVAAATTITTGTVNCDGTAGGIQWILLPVMGKYYECLVPDDLFINLYLHVGTIAAVLPVRAI